MTRIEKKFRELSERGKTALVAYVTAGDPSLETTKRIVIELERAGVDIIELGVPFSDPMADGPTIQLASERALNNGTNLHKILYLVEEMREETQIPILLFGYYNPFFKYGLGRFAVSARDVGVDGILVVDLPPEESDEFKIHLDNSGLNTVFLLAPNSTEERIALVSQKATGFVYLVSVTGVTGTRPDLEYSLKDLSDKIKRKTSLPVGIGFGVSSPKQARMISDYADAVIVGSALIKLVERNLNRESELLKSIYTFASELSEACHGTKR